MRLPDFRDTGDLPAGIHAAGLNDVIDRFGSGTPRRRLLGMRLKRVYELALATGQVHRAVVFGSFVTAKADPNDVDLFFIMADTFNLNQVTGEARVVFEHAAAQAHFGASVFWVRLEACFPSEKQLMASWEIKRDGTRRGLIEFREQE